MEGSLLAAIGARLGETLGRRISLRQTQTVGGGCIHSAWRVGDGENSWFVKANAADSADMFAAEADGLEALARTPLRVPRALAHGAAKGKSFIVLEWLTLATGAPQAYASLGEQLARMHLTAAAHFGWHRGNYIGATTQANPPEDSWTRFFGRARLAPQLSLARANGHAALHERGQALLQALPRLLRGHAPRPALLHGDLWSGNAAFTAQGMPVVFDPAVYYGDREADLAMTELFGAFAPDFYAAYRAHAPLDPGYRMRKTLYNLYHILNHANLFGGGYVARADAMIERLLAEA